MGSGISDHFLAFSETFSPFLTELSINFSDCRSQLDSSNFDQLKLLNPIQTLKIFGQSCTCFYFKLIFLPLNFRFEYKKICCCCLGIFKSNKYIGSSVSMSLASWLMRLTPDPVAQTPDILSSLFSAC